MFQAICQVGIFMICAQAIVHFKPNGSYGKYLKMLVSVMLLIQIFLPVAKIFSQDAGLNIEKRVEWFEQNVEEVTKQAVNRAFQSEEVLERMTLEEVQSRLEEAEGEGAETAGLGEEKESGEGEADGGDAAEEGLKADEDLKANEDSENVRVEKIRIKVGQTDEAE